MRTFALLPISMTLLLMLGVPAADKGVVSRQPPNLCQVAGCSGPSSVWQKDIRQPSVYADARIVGFGRTTITPSRERKSGLGSGSTLTKSPSTAGTLEISNTTRCACQRTEPTEVHNGIV
jgi:hypothetical protein